MKPKAPKRPIGWLVLSARIGLGAVFIFASWNKIVDPAAFADTIANYQILPQIWINPSALLLPWVELICGLGLITGVFARGSVLIVTLLLLIFGGAIAYSAYRGLDIHCGCFSTGNGVPANLYLDFIRDLALLAVAVWILLYYGRTHTTRHKSV